MKHMQTPSQTVGPFFHYGLMVEQDQNVLYDEMTRGQRIHIKGQVIDGKSQPVTDAMIEIWQADAGGHHNHPSDPNQAQADPHFKGFGRVDTVHNGQFLFRTIKPGRVAYDAEADQAPHINVRVFSRGMLIHAYTRLYFSDEEEANKTDPVLNLVPADRRYTLVASREDTGELPTYCFNVVLQGEMETVFFNP
ncbi:MAG: protocatechuate 3,4-dioxygenase subunit alpha [Anaerolineae bacterium]|nr:protocatechuate 3,4-dioxygenase subunit alpha [Anaerolineae bacterium]